MAASAGKNIVLLVIAVAIGAIAYQIYQRKTNPPAPPPTTPPANAEFLDEGVTAEDLMVEYLGVPRSQMDAVAAQYVGLWVPEPGWKGAVEGWADLGGTRSVSVYHHRATIIGGGFWVLAHVSDPPNFNKGDHVRLTGQISSIEVLPGGPAPIHRIVLEPATVTADRP